MVRFIKQIDKELQRFKDIENSDTTPICNICGSSDCYEVSVQNEFLCKNYFQNINGFVCKDCYQFQYKTGIWFTHLQLFILNTLVKVKKYGKIHSKETI